MLVYKSKFFQTAVVAGTLAFSNVAEAQIISNFDYGILVGPSTVLSVAPNSFGSNPFAHLTVTSYSSWTEYNLSINNNLFSSFGSGAYLGLISFDYNPNPSGPVTSTLLGSSVAGMTVQTVPGTNFILAYDFGTLFQAGTLGNNSYVKWRVDGVGNVGGYQLMNSLVSVGNITVPSSLGPYTAKYTILPVPEPETYAMLLAGLGLLGFTALRKKPQSK